MSRSILIKLAAFVMALILLAGIASAFGIAPGNVDLVFEPGAEHTIKFKLMNTEKANIQVVLYAEGELAQYITFEKNMIEFNGEDEIRTSYTLKLPPSFDKQGAHTANIVARVVPKSDSSDGVGMSATVAVISKLALMVPYSGKYAEITLFSPNFEQGRESNFAVEVKNLGTGDILKGQVVIDIFGPTGNKLATLNGDSFALASKQSQVVTIPWNPSIGAGTYRAVANLIYDGSNARDERTFAVGELSIDIVDITVRDFRLGGIAMFEIMLENKWNERVPGVYGLVSVKDESGKTYTEFKTASVDIGDGDKQQIEAYWDTKSVGPGRYKLGIVLNYLGKSTEKVFDILVSADKIDTTLGGMAVTESGKKTEPVLQGIYILTFLVVVLIIFNVVMFLRKPKRDK